MKYKCDRALITGFVAGGGAVAAGLVVGRATGDAAKAASAAIATGSALVFVSNEIQK